MTTASRRTGASVSSARPSAHKRTECPYSAIRAVSPLR